MMRTYAIGDIHGQLGKLRLAHALIAEDRARVGDFGAPVVHIGDLPDRGPDTRGVIQFLIDGQARGENWVMLKGNHDRMMAWFLEDVPRRDPRLRAQFEWLHPRLGGIGTLASYGVDTDRLPDTAAIHAAALAAVPRSHRSFLANLPTRFERGGVFYCHAGIRPGVPLDRQAEDDLCWIRDEFYVDPCDHGALIVHGHTPVDAVTHYGNRVNIDTGAGFDRDLSAVVIDGRDVSLLTADGRMPIGVTR